MWDKKAQANIPRLMKFMNDFGLITARDPQGQYHAMTDVIHKVLNDITVDDWAIIIGGDSHTRMSKGVAFGADSGTVALALATGEASMPIPESVKVTFKGSMATNMDFRDVVHATQAQMLKQFGGENVFQGRVIEVHIGTLQADQAFTFTDWTAEMKAKASICISDDKTLIESLEIAKSRIGIMIEKGMDNANKVLQGLIDQADKRIAEITSGEKPALAPDASAKYYAEFSVDLDQISEPMIADPDVHNDDPSKRYTHDTIRPLSYYGGEKAVDLGFVGSCMVHKGDMKILAGILKNLEAENGSVEFKAPLVVAPPTYNIIDELKTEGDWEPLAKYAGFVFDDNVPKNAARTEYDNQLYLERPGCNLCMGNQEKAAKGDTCWQPPPASSKVVWWPTPPKRKANRYWLPPLWWCCQPSLAASQPSKNIAKRCRASNLLTSPHRWQNSLPDLRIHESSIFIVYQSKYPELRMEIEPFTRG